MEIFSGILYCTFPLTINFVISVFPAVPKSLIFCGVSF